MPFLLDEIASDVIRIAIKIPALQGRQPGHFFPMLTRREMIPLREKLVGVPADERDEAQMKIARDWWLQNVLDETKGEYGFPEDTPREQWTKAILEHKHGPDHIWYAVAGYLWATVPTGFL